MGMFAPALAVLVAALATSAPAASEHSEDELKAGLVFRFASFVEWPADAIATNGALVIGVLGSDGVAAQLEGLTAGRSVAGSQVTVRRLDSIAAAKECHVVFVGKAAQARIEALLAELAGRSVFTISDSARFARSGGMVQLTRRRTRISFEVHRGAIARAGLRISPKVLTLAAVVHEDPRPAGAVK